MSKTNLKSRIDALPLDLQARLVADTQTVIEYELLPILETDARKRNGTERTERRCING
ncbi:MAG: hypothetical protein ABR909_07005 [Candidatus Bathyarchaeia archaeon]